MEIEMVIRTAPKAILKKTHQSLPSKRNFFWKKGKVASQETSFLKDSKKAHKRTLPLITLSRSAVNSSSTMFRRLLTVIFIFLQLEVFVFSFAQLKAT